MNLLVKISRGSLLLFLALMLGGCLDEEMDTPPLNEPDDILSIAELRALYNGQTVRFEENIVVFATVTMDESSGNIFRNVFVQDETAGINVRMDFAGDLVTGEQIRLALKGTALGSYNNMLQLDSVEYGKNLISQNSMQDIEPASLSIPEILSGDHQATLVRLDDVQFAGHEIGQRFANTADGLSENRTLTDCSNNRIVVRTSPFATFANQQLPDGNGSLVAIVSQFGSTWQLLIRNTDELDMTGERCDSGEPKGSGSFDDPYNVAHAIQFNSGNDVWVEGYIVGTMESSGNANVPTFNPPFTTMTNLIIADNPDDTDDSRILPVQLPSGRVREALNLPGNPDNKGKLVKIKGNLAAYFVPRPGLREASGYWLDGQGIGDGGIWDNLTPITIGEVRDLYQGSNIRIPDKRMITGIVISDRNNENITGRNLHIIDASDGTGIVMRFSSFHAFEIGSLIRVDVSNIEVSRFNGLMQIADIPNNQGDLIESTTIPDAEETTIANILSNMSYYESRLVKIKNVSISGGSTWRGSNGSLTLNDGTASITHYTTSYAAFANEKIPSGKVGLTVIVSVFHNPQVYIRNLEDIESP